jgi:hypothetical protein
LKTQEQGARSRCPKPYAKIESSRWAGKTMYHVLSGGLEGVADKPGLTYKWSISPGTITSGQGTPSVTLEMPECKCDFHLKMEVEGLEPGCENSIEWAIFDICFYPAMTDSYGDVSVKDENARLGKFASVLQREQCWMLKITASGKKGERAGAALAKARRAKRFIVDTFNVRAEQIEVIDGGIADARKIELFLYHR